MTSPNADPIFDLKRYRGTSWYDSLLVDFDAFRKRFLILFFMLGLFLPAAVSIASLLNGEKPRLEPAIITEFCFALGLFFSIRASRPHITRISRFVLAHYPILYLASVFWLDSNHSYVLLLIAMPPISMVLSPREEKLGWLVYSSASILLANILALVGVPSSWLVDFTAGEVIVIHAAASIVAAISYLWDARGSRNLEAQARRILQDPGTGLATAAALIEVLKQKGRSLVCIVSISNFYELSTLFGYEFSDEILAYAASRLRQAAEEMGGHCFRLHGRDLGAVWLDCDERDEDSQEMLARLLAEISGPADLRGKRVEIQYSIGYTVCEDGNAARALNEAGGALWHKAGSHGVFRHDPHTGGAREAEQSFARLATLSACVRESGLEAHFQPIVRMSDRKPAWCEALLRVRREDGRLETPWPYLELARSAGYMEAIGDFILDRARARIGAGLGSVSINVDLGDLRRRGFILAAAEGSQEARESGSRLILEFLETDYTGFTPEDLADIEELRAKGCLIAIDDFGSGYSNYSRLLSLPADIVKFDISLVHRALQEPSVEVLVAGLLRFCSDAGALTVAEGVEDEASADRLAAMGFDFGQGFLWSRAHPSEEVPGIEVEALRPRAARKPAS